MGRVLCSMSKKRSVSERGKKGPTLSDDENFRPFPTALRGIPEPMAADAKSVLKMIKDKEVKFVDLRFTDPRGKWQHVTFDLSLIDEDAFTHGLMFDGSSIAGWKAINESDMTLMPDPASAVIDPFFSQTPPSLFFGHPPPPTGAPPNSFSRF